MKRLFALIAFAILIIPGQLGAASLYANPDGTGGCDPNPGRTCYWEWADTDTLADISSNPYNVAKVNAMTYFFTGDGGTAKVQVKECSVNDATSTTCTTFTGDMNGDGVITAADRAIQLDGTVGLDGLYAVTVAKPWHFVYVIALPGSGSVSLVAKAHSF